MGPRDALALVVASVVLCSSMDGAGALLLTPRLRKAAAATAAGIAAAAAVAGPVEGALAANDAPAVQRKAPPLFGIGPRGRLLGCPRSGNCVSTSAVSSIQLYGSPWTYNEPDDQAWDHLKAAVAEDPLLKVVDVDDSKRYIHATAPSAVPPQSLDDVEWLMFTDSHVVTYRSNSRARVRVAGTVLPDGGSHKNRLESVRKRLGWSFTGDDDETAELERQRGRRSLQQVIREGSNLPPGTFED